MPQENFVGTEEYGQKKDLNSRPEAPAWRLRETGDYIQNLPDTENLLSASRSGVQYQHDKVPSVEELGFLGTLLGLTETSVREDGKEQWGEHQIMTPRKQCCKIQQIDIIQLNSVRYNTVKLNTNFTKSTLCHSGHYSPILSLFCVELCFNRFKYEVSDILQPCYKEEAEDVFDEADQGAAGQRHHWDHGAQGQHGQHRRGSSVER